MFLCKSVLAGLNRPTLYLVWSCLFPKSGLSSLEPSTDLRRAIAGDLGKLQRNMVDTERFVTRLVNYVRTRGGVLPSLAAIALISGRMKKASLSG